MPHGQPTRGCGGLAGFSRFRPARVAGEWATMCRRLRILLLAVPLLAAFGPTRAGAAGNERAPAPPPASRAVSAPTSDAGLVGGLGFRSLHALMNRETWPSLAGDGTALRTGPAVLDAAEPLQAVVLFNAWHLPAARGRDDIRLRDLRERLLSRKVTFGGPWPAYSLPGYVVLLRRADGEWVLVARLSGHFLVEDASGIGLCAVPSP